MVLRVYIGITVFKEDIYIGLKKPKKRLIYLYYMVLEGYIDIVMVLNLTIQT